VTGVTPRNRARTPALDLDDLASEVVQRTIEIAAVPAPSGQEGHRAAVVAGWWRDAGFQEISSDGAGNCWAQARGGHGPAIVLAAHLDTVFGPGAEHGARRTGDRLVGPSVGDNSVALAALPALGRLLAEAEGTIPILVLATVGEEGYGNLAGARHAVAHPQLALDAFIAIEGNYLGRLGTIGIGSQRWRAVISGPGGHAWEASTAASAVHEAARLVHQLSMIPTAAGITSLNVGSISGGEAINARARRASFELELRGTDDATLGDLDASAHAVLGRLLPDGLTVELTDTGRRPAGRVDPGHPLVAAAREALESRSIAWREVASSTDANAAHAVGLPAIALGVTTGSGEHTPAEWIDIPPIAGGLAALVDTVVGYERRRDSGGHKVRTDSGGPPAAGGDGTEVDRR
jgi:tripeptide aminopeptidase